jgi:hypothetical protein
VIARIIRVVGHVVIKDNVDRLYRFLQGTATQRHHDRYGCDVTVCDPVVSSECKAVGPAVTGRRRVDNVGRWLSLPLTLSAGQSTTFSASFTPTAAGSVNGNITVTSTAANPTLSVALSGTGVTQGSLAANPTSINFGSVQVGVAQESLA